MPTLWLPLSVLTPPTPSMLMVPAPEVRIAVPTTKSTNTIYLTGTGKLYRWSTYNRAREVRLEVDDTHVRWSLTGRDGPDAPDDVPQQRAARPGRRAPGRGSSRSAS